MRTSEIEAWAIRVIEAVENGQPNEDDRVELKAIWVDAEKAARRIAGHANSMRGETILWLVGVDEKRGVTGASQLDPSRWWATVVSQFDEVEPNAQFVNVYWGDKTVVAIAFDTERAPFVVKNPEADSRQGVVVHREIPWRTATGIRSAKRQEVMRLLAPLARMPDVDILGGHLNLFRSGVDQIDLGWYLRLRLLVEPRTEGWVVFPNDRCQASFAVPGQTQYTPFGTVYLDPPHRNSEGRSTSAPNVSGTMSEVMINGPAAITLHGNSHGVFSTDDAPSGDIEIVATLSPTRVEYPITLRTTLHRIPPDDREREANDPSGPGLGPLATWVTGQQLSL